jgi:hypothetical protein
MTPDAATFKFHCRNTPTFTLCFHAFTDFRLVMKHATVRYWTLTRPARRRAVKRLYFILSGESRKRGARFDLPDGVLRAKWPTFCSARATTTIFKLALRFALGRQ